MPAPLTSHRLVQRQAEMRRASLSFLRPDAKSQLTFRYDEDGNPTGIDAVVLSTQHSPDISQQDLHEAIMEEVIKPVLPQSGFPRTPKFSSTQPANLSSAAQWATAA